jgi:catechol 2,3-dioxygenase-like lactoylglutathione lyase family enzyme
VQATGITANLPVPDIGEARDFYVDYLGLSVEGFNMGWVARYQSPDGRAVVQLVTRDATGVERAHRELRARLADRLRRDDADRLAELDQPPGREVAAVDAQSR